MEQRKVAWLARAYAAEAECKARPEPSRANLDVVLTEMQLILPEGGAIPREVQRLRAGCGSGRPAGATIARR